MRFSSLRNLLRPLQNRFQVSNHTLPDRYPWLFQFAAGCLGDVPGQRLLSFGCSIGDEVFSLQKYFPQARIKGLDVDPRNIAKCRARAAAAIAANLSFAVAADTRGEVSASYDAIFCLSVLCLGSLTTSGAKRCDPLLTFESFERTVTDFARCLRPGGMLFLHTTSFRLQDCAVAKSLTAILEAEPGQMAPDVLFDRNNRLLAGERYHAVAFRKLGG